MLLGLMLLGFQQFYLQGKAYPGREIAPPVRTLIITHGVAMSAWMLLFLVQPLLIANRRYRVHMILGSAGAILAAVIFLLGLCVGVESTRVAPADLRIWGLSPRQFMAVPIISIVLFAIFVAIGVWKRRSADIHRPMMLLATLTAMPAAVSRIDFLNAIYVGTVWETIFGPFLMTLVVGAAFLVVKWLLSRSFDWPYALGYLAFFVVSLLTLVAGRTAAWGRLASLLLD